MTLRLFFYLKGESGLDFELAGLRNVINYRIQSHGFREKKFDPRELIGRSVAM